MFETWGISPQNSPFLGPLSVFSITLAYLDFFLTWVVTIFTNYYKIDFESFFVLFLVQKLQKNDVLNLTNTNINADSQRMFWFIPLKFLSNWAMMILFFGSKSKQWYLKLGVNPQKSLEVCFSVNILTCLCVIAFHVEVFLDIIICCTCAILRG